ncbi:hypothetical protein [Alkalihalobacillus sp. LMS39]|uniref:hypothetical protein n=1 Tax=Alkalihalobacillus sp. LMS39 TaxID=2924032 RepID=UPI001FB2DAA9|nr:hypothetical protein [Alkalihalobacillus sp. LMS39]UOE93163.1 hypothetical protein MM271_18440 [Alkalihalobacillus sp. LMS39]
MIFRFIMLLVGFGLAVSGGISILAYLNLFAVGYDVSSFSSFIVRRVEFYLLIGGFFIITLCLYWPSSSKKKSHKNL